MVGFLSYVTYTFWKFKENVIIKEEMAVLQIGKQYNYCLLLKWTLQNSCQLGHEGWEQVIPLCWWMTEWSVVNNKDNYFAGHHLLFYALLCPITSSILLLGSLTISSAFHWFCSGPFDFTQLVVVEQSTLLSSLFVTVLFNTMAPKTMPSTHNKGGGG